MNRNFYMTKLHRASKWTNQKLKTWTRNLSTLLIQLILDSSLKKCLQKLNLSVDVLLTRRFELEFQTTVTLIRRKTLLTKTTFRSLIAMRIRWCKTWSLKITVSQNIWFPFRPRHCTWIQSLQAMLVITERLLDLCQQGLMEGQGCLNTAKIKTKN